MSGMDTQLYEIVNGFNLHCKNRQTQACSWFKCVLKGLINEEKKYLVDKWNNVIKNMFAVVKDVQHSYLPKRMRPD